MIVLDTHVWVWWVSAPESLSPSVRQRIDDEAGKNPIYISSLGGTLIKKDRKIQDYPHIETFW